MPKSFQIRLTGHLGDPSLFFCSSSLSFLVFYTSLHITNRDSIIAKYRIQVHRRRRTDLSRKIGISLDILHARARIWYNVNHVKVVQYRWAVQSGKTLYASGFGKIAGGNVAYS